MTGVAVIVWLALVFGPLVAWALFRGRGYKRRPLEQPPPGPGWGPTAECFQDPTTGRPIRVWHHAASGERAYVADAAGYSAAARPRDASSAS